MLSLLTILSCVVSVTIALTITRDGYYDTKYNHLDIERVLNNKRLVMYYGQCLLGEGPCTPQGTEFKRILPEALQTNCARCTEKQKVTAYLAIRRLKKEYPTIWQKMQANWDPNGELVSRFINDVETKSTLDGIVKIGNTNTQQAAGPQQQQQAVVNNEVPQNIFNRFGEETTDNEINTGSSVATNQNQNQITQTKAPVPSALPLQSAQVIPNIQSVTAFNNNPNQIASSAAASQVIRDTSASITTTTTTTTTTTERVPTTTFLNYRTSSRPNRVVLIPRPIDLGRLTVNVFAQVADVGTKVIRTGARIADMVFRPIFNNNNTNNNRN